MDEETEVETAGRGTKGRAAAVSAFCKQCIYDKHAAGTWRQQVEACTSLNCPLYDFRPVSSGEKVAAEA